MRKQTFSDDQIRDAIRQLRERGQSVTAFAVRNYLGGGNHRRIQVLIDKAQNQSATKGLPEDAALTIRPVLGEIAAAADRLALTLWSYGERVSGQHVAALQQQIIRLEEQVAQEREQAFNEIERLNGEVDTARRETATERKAKEKALERLNLAERIAAEVRGELNSMRVELSRRDREIADLRAELLDRTRRTGELEALLQSALSN